MHVVMGNHLKLVTAHLFYPNLSVLHVSFNGDKSNWIILSFLESKKFCDVIGQVVSVVLENYGGPRRNSENSGQNQSRWVEEVRKKEGHVSPLPDVSIRVPSWRLMVNEKGEINVPM